MVAVLVAGLTATGPAAVFHLDRVRLRNMQEEGARRSQAILSVLEQPGAGLGSLNAISTLAAAAAALFTLLIALDLAASPASGAALAIGVLTGTLLVQTIGRTIAEARPEQTALAIQLPLHLTAMLLAPVVRPFVGLERAGLAKLGVSRPNDPHAAEEQLRQLLDPSESTGVLEREEREMIHGVIELSLVPAREVMVPRVYVTSVNVDATIGDALDVVVSSGHSRLPMFDGSVDRVCGVVYAKDILKHLRTGHLDDPVRPLAREPYFVPEVKKVDELLQELQQRRVHIAIVVDEYGGTAGLITIEDLIEEIVGEIRDEYDVAEEEPVLVISAQEALVDGRATIRDINDRFSLDLPDDESDTVGGLVYQQVGHIPVEGDQVQVDGCILTVTATQGRRIRKVRLTLGAAASEV
ncbi:MAG: HlyC/CorC family transporter [Chloroflexi bacterium]|nr:HlyC/CorC family transporter [Chloroflexota bacterium]